MALRKPLLPTSCHRQAPLEPLLLVTFLNTMCRVAADTPALCLLFQDLAADSGFDLASTVIAFGQLAALRSLVELAATPLLARWSDSTGRRGALCLCCLGCCLECLLLATSRSLVSLSLVHIIGGMLASHNAIEGSCIVDACPDGLARVEAFERLFLSLGVAIVLGPAVGGELSAYRREAPFAAAALLAGSAAIYVWVRVPEYLPQARRQRLVEERSVQRSFGEFVRMLRREPSLRWYIAASMLSSVGISAFLSVRTLWVRHNFGWDGREIGRVAACYGVTVMAAQFFFLPLLLWCMRGSEVLLAQLCLLVHAARFAGYSLSPSGTCVYLVLFLATAGNCSVPVLQGLCCRCVAEDEHALLSGGASALNTASQVLGSLLGSQLFASALRGTSRPNAHLMLSAMSFFCAVACTLLAERAEQAQRAEASSPKHAASWIQRAEGMHGMDAGLPAPTARGSMLGRQAWVQQRGRADSH
eukprot:TRINITY_DN50688_c0_g1_i1.p1 TRINITY_DN50688_c0_g1~~TRINITY_DN50688_c0_g1_i1.p1  ORF type:complete len:488 (+),score=90.25 TRINITY_DN50688_c0_g1_i1:44-1465(+)